jgi:hypothetical protein
VQGARLHARVINVVLGGGVVPRDYGIQQATSAAVGEHERCVIEILLS